jgi:glutathione S-transferase
LQWTTMFGLVPETPEIKSYLQRTTTRPAAERVMEKDAALAALQNPS